MTNTIAFENDQKICKKLRNINNAFVCHFNYRFGFNIIFSGILIEVTSLDTTPRSHSAEVVKLSAFLSVTHLDVCDNVSILITLFGGNYLLAQKDLPQVSVLVY